MVSYDTNEKKIIDFVKRNLKEKNGKKYIESSVIDSLFDQYDFNDYYVDLLNDLMLNMNIEIHENNVIDEGKEEEYISNGKFSKYVDGTKVFFDLISKYQILSTSEERNLFERFTNETDPVIKKSIKDKIILSNLRLVVSVAKNYRSNYLTFDDFIQEGILGLDKAVDKFDLLKGTRFSSYACWWIRQAISRAKAEKENIIRRPVGVFESETKIKKIINDFKKLNGYDPSIKELSIITGLDEKKLSIMLINMEPCFSLNKQLSNKNEEGDAPVELMDFVSDSTSFVDGVEEEELNRILTESINSVTINKTGADKYLENERDMIVEFIVQYKRTMNRLNVEKRVEINDKLSNHKIIQKAIIYMQKELNELDDEILEVERKLLTYRPKKLIVYLSNLKNKRNSIEMCLNDYKQNKIINNDNFNRVIELLSSDDAQLSKDYLDKFYDIQNKYNKKFNNEIKYYNKNINDIHMIHEKLGIIQGLVEKIINVSPLKISIYDIYKNYKTNAINYVDIIKIGELYIKALCLEYNLGKEQKYEINRLKYNLYIILNEESSLILNTPLENYNILINKYKSIRLNDILLKRVFTSKPYVLEQVAYKYDITKERVRQLEVKALRLLRKYFSIRSNREKLREYIDEDYFKEKFTFLKK